jgi:hypothetical protein
MSNPKAGPNVGEGSATEIGGAVANGWKPVIPFLPRRLFEAHLGIAPWALGSSKWQLGRGTKPRQVRLELFNFNRNYVANIPPAVLVTRHHQTKTRRGRCLVVSTICEKRRFSAKIGGDLAGRKDDDVIVACCDFDHVAELGSFGRVIDPAGFAEQGPKGHAGEICFLDAAAGLIRDRYLLRRKPLQGFQIELLRMFHLADNRHHPILVRCGCWQDRAIVGVRGGPEDEQGDQGGGDTDPTFRRNIVSV